MYTLLTLVLFVGNLNPSLHWTDLELDCVSDDAFDDALPVESISIASSRVTLNPEPTTLLFDCINSSSREAFSVKEFSVGCSVGCSLGN